MSRYLYARLLRVLNRTRYTANNFNNVMARNAALTIVEVKHVLWLTVQRVME